jgi:hypothetical protein
VWNRKYTFSARNLYAAASPAKTLRCNNESLTCRHDVSSPGSRVAAPRTQLLWANNSTSVWKRMGPIQCSLSELGFVWFEVLTAVNVNTDLTLYNPVQIRRRFGVTHCLHLQGRRINQARRKKSLLAGVPAATRTEHLPNTSLERFTY